MRDENRKDEQLDSLFKAYIEEEEIPPERVTDKAKRYMQGEPERVEVTEPVFAAGTGAGGAQAGRHTKNMRLVWICVAFLSVVVLLLLWYFLHDNGNFFTTLSGYSRVSRSQLTETSPEYREQEFLPFVESEDVAVYKEYALKEDVNPYRRGDVVLYYLEYTAQTNVQAQLYVEMADIDFDELDAYKSLEDHREYENITYYIGSAPEAARTYIYFRHDAYSYNLRIDSSSETSVEAVLKNIDDHF